MTTQIGFVPTPSGLEMFLLLLLAALLFGTERIPEMARSAGKAMREFQESATEVKKEVTDVTSDVEEIKDDIESDIEEVESDFEQTIAGKDPDDGDGSNDDPITVVDDN